MLKVQTIEPDGRLREYVRSYVQRESGALTQEVIEPVVARLGAMLEFQFGRPLEVPIYGTSHTLYSPQIGVIGPMSQRTYQLIIRDRVEALTVLFRPLGFHELFGTPTSMFSNVGIEGHSVLGKRVSDLFEQLGNLRNFAARARLLDQYLLGALALARPVEPLHGVFEQLTNFGPQLEVSRFAQSCGVSVRQIERRSLEFTGFSPKMASRIARFQETLRLRSTSTLSWAQVAHSLGYFDQMHMIRDYKAFSGEAPGRAMEQIAPDHLISL